MKIGGYFDYNAGTPQSDGVKKAMMAAMELFANPSATYPSAVRSKTLIQQARQNVARLIGAEPEQIVFTSGGTESNNWILHSIMERASKGTVFVTTAIEHDAILSSGRIFCDQSDHFMYVVLPTHEGIVTAGNVAEICGIHSVSLLSVMLANNETGAIQPIADIAKVAKKKGAFFHVDAVQAAGKIPIDVNALGCDSLTLSAHKFYGPKGIGALYLRDPQNFSPFIIGGGQENGLRAGTENITGIAGFGVAAAEVFETLETRIKHNQSIRKVILAALDTKKIPYIINGPTDDRFVMANTLNLSFPGFRAEALVVRLGICNDIAVSLGSACSTNKDRRHSHVLQAMGLDEERLVSAIRISFGTFTEVNDAKLLVSGLEEALVMSQGIAEGGR